MAARLPHDETARIASLLGCGVLDTSPERAFDDIAELASVVTAAPIALVTFVDSNRQWFKARVGLELTETPRDVSFCAHAILGREPMIVRDAREDARFATNPLVLDDPNIRFYAGVPIAIDPGCPLGSLCVLDREARDITPEQMSALRALARRVEAELRARRERLRGAGPGVPAAGTRLLDRYVLGEALGAGGMGVVVAATDEATGARVAIKFLTATLAGGEEATERFTREARALLQIDNPRVARIFDVGNLADGAPFIVMEYLDGEDLDALAARGPLPIETAVNLVLQACEGLAAAHALGIVHRDVKPGNLFVTRSADGAPAVKVLDFGVSKFVADGTGKDGAPVGQLTGATGVLGSPQYMSPEQMLSSRDVDARSDVWSLGAVLYELVTGSAPFSGASLTEICAKVLTQAPLAPRALRAEVDPGLESAILGCLTRAPEERCPTVRALATQLLAYASPAQRRASSAAPFAPPSVAPESG